ncbi:hypothetical protein K6119_10490 [Paracrocinitomix mangrovi]|uniref:hypothetical protein n=1 Tax=Paracrocinitomix mangrovi TaxID=2862509 RepID=UPI001C8F18A5|nr:hypothetical protein [Paracrocinitomix mangrovi]UKN00162.1 hypothetical protein K6119_10490 [Paracrocinitomix mangrovi]
MKQLLTFVLVLTCTFSWSQDTLAQRSPVTIKLGSYESGDTAQYKVIKNVKYFVISDAEGVVAKGYQIVGGKMMIEGLNFDGKIEKNGILDKSALSLIRSSKGKKLSAEIRYNSADGVTRLGAFVLFIQ